MAGIDSLSAPIDSSVLLRVIAVAKLDHVSELGLIVHVDSWAYQPKARGPPRPTGSARRISTPLPANHLFVFTGKPPLRLRR